MIKRANITRGILLAGLAMSLPAQAGLGRVSVLSRLGEPFRAEISLTGVRAAELDGARIGLADASTFRDMNVDLQPEVSAFRFAWQKTRDGAVITISTKNPVSEPYLRFVVAARLASGTENREYTVLLDPSGYAVPGIGQIVQDSPDYAQDNLASRYTRKPAKAAKAPVKTAKAPAKPVVRRAVTSASAAVPEKAVHGAGVAIQPGDTLRTFALRVKPKRASLSQTMAAIFQANPDAFDNGDANQLKPGSHLRVPEPERILALSDTRARQILAAPAAPRVDPSSPSARDVTRHEAASHVLAEPPKVEPAHPASAPLAAHAEASAPDAAVVALREQVAKKDASLGEAQLRIFHLESQLKTMERKERAASEAAASAARASQGGALAHYWPWLAGGGTAVLALLGGLLFWRSRRKQEDVAPDTAAAPVQPAGKPVKGSEPPPPADDVDPLAEAEVYLSYGRDSQAEDILRAALAKDPARHDIRMKLLEIYHQNHDTQLFALHAREIEKAFEGQGPQWGRVVVMGKAIDPENPLYGSSEALLETPLDDLEAELMANDDAAVPASPPEPVFTDQSVLPVEEAPAVADGLDFDLETDLAAVSTEPAVTAPASEDNLLDFDFSLDSKEATATTAPVAADDPFASLYTEEEAAPVATATVPAAEVREGGNLDNDPQAAKLDLAKVYMDMGDNEGAREVLTEMLDEAGDTMKREIESLLERIGS